VAFSHLPVQAAADSLRDCVRLSWFAVEATLLPEAFEVQLLERLFEEPGLD
jgi:hypothetical protein